MFFGDTIKFTQVSLGLIPEILNTESGIQTPRQALFYNGSFLIQSPFSSF